MLKKKKLGKHLTNLAAVQDSALAFRERELNGILSNTFWDLFVSAVSLCARPATIQT